MAEITETTDISLSDSSLKIKNDKRERKNNAQTLPPGLTHNMMKKYVVYYREIMYLKNGKTQPREYFKVESHPRLKKPWVSSKSVKLSLIEKLNAANQVVADLEENDAEPSTPNTYDASYNLNEEKQEHIFERLSKCLPKYTSLRIVKDNPKNVLLSIIYDKKDIANEFRWTSSRTFNIKYTSFIDMKMIVANELQNLRKKIINKYGVDLLFV
jgi:hypothetical protein